MRAVLLLSLVAAAQAFEQPDYNTSVAMLASGAFDVILDVRSESEFEVAHIEGAVLWSRTNLSQCTEGTVIAVYCWTGYDRSTPAATFIESDNKGAAVWDLGGLQYLGPEGAKTLSGESEWTVACVDSAAAPAAAADEEEEEDEEEGTEDGNEEEKKEGCGGGKFGQETAWILIGAVIVVVTFFLVRSWRAQRKAQQAHDAKETDVASIAPVIAVEGKIVTPAA